MNRVEFTALITSFIQRMFQEGENPIIDYVKRSTTEQKHLFDIGLSKCDGINKISQHQYGKAVDICFQDLGDVDRDGITTELIPPLHGWEYWHSEWEKMGGKPILDWDKGHFEI
jgi:hypothetical protein